MSDPPSDPSIDPQLLVPITPAERLLTAAEFHRLAEVPPEIGWFANITNPHTRRAYENAIDDFMRFTGINGGRFMVTKPIVAIRIPLRKERRHPQPGQRRQTTEG